MAFIDYYKILEIDRKATDKDIKKAYHKLARKYHPDVNLDDANAKIKFQEINEANEVLSNAENRKKYDKYGKDWKHGKEFEKSQHQQQRSNRQQEPGGFDPNDSSFFESLFGRTNNHGKSGGTNIKFKGQDYNAELHLNLKEVYETHKRTLTINGKNIRLTIPAGVENGQVIKIKGHGEQGMNGGLKGDLQIKFLITNHTKFKRDKDNLYVSVDIDLYKSILGGEIILETFNGKVKLKVKPESKNGTTVKLKGKGFPVYKKDNQFGDLYVTYQIKIPTNLTNKEKELLEELAQLR